MAELYGPHDTLPADLADHVIEDSIPVGPPIDQQTANADTAEDEE